MKKNLIYNIALVVVAFIATSCTDEDTDQGFGKGDGIFRLSSDKGTFTRAAGDELTFEAGTAYQLYAIEGSDFSKNYLKNPVEAGAITGREANNNNSIEGIEVNKFNGKTLNFYSVTNSTNDPVDIIQDSSNAPTCDIRYKDSNTPLTDVMWAKKENQSYQNSGIIKLLFGHTLAKLNLYVMKNSEYNSTMVTLNSISLTDYPSGSLNMQTGKYNLANDDRRSQECTVYTGGKQSVTTTAATVQNNNVNVAPMVFPTRKEVLTESDRNNHSMFVKVGVNIDGSNTTKEIEITSTLAEGAGNTKEVPFKFESNHEYDMVITITKSSLVVTIVPRLYEWIPEEELKPEDQVNGSMTVGGITWMDRNMGATSGDPLAGDQAWENSRGYYYQFGRNIPYYIKTKRDSHGIEYAPASGNWHLSESMPYPFIPGNMDAAPIAVPNYYDATKTAQFPTDKNKKFNFYYSGNWDGNQGYSRSNWTSTSNQPCPKGWRIPTKNEFQLIIPGSEKAGDIPFKLSGHKGTTYTENLDNDPENGSMSVYIGVKKGTWTETNAGITNAIYALKKIGTNNAYFLRWHIERSGKYELVNQCTGDKGDPYRNVLVISRYPATNKSILSDSNVRNAAKWNNPVEQIKLPISGYIHTGQEYANSGTTRPALIYSGSEAVYWTSTMNSNNSYTVRMKFAGDAASNQIMMYATEIRSNGCLVRCVRDTKAD